MGPPMNLVSKVLTGLGVKNAGAKPFNERPEAERALKARAATETLTELEIPTSASQSWDYRAQLAAEMLASVKSVTDIGCGAMALESHLPDAIYKPVDCVSRDARTLVVDLNRENAPTLGTDAVSLLGVLEHIHDVPKLLKELASSYPLVLVTYNPTDLSADHASPANVWVNAYSIAEMEAEFTRARLRIKDMKQVGSQVLWLLASESQPLQFRDAFAANYNDQIQVSQYQCQAIGGAIRSRSPGCRMLVFGVGNDTPLWLALNPDGETHFLEGDQNWIAAIKEKIPDISIALFPDHGTTVQGSATMGAGDLSRFPPPPHLSNREWDVILVDGPLGYAPDDPGRAISIYWASKLASDRTHVFVDDYDRDIEMKFADELLKARDTASMIVPSSDKASYRKMFWSMGSIVRSDEKPVVLSVATPDYARQWRFCIDSQKTYCSRNQYDHRVIDPTRSKLHPKWTKLELAIDQLTRGNDVLLIDADAEISRTCPPFTRVLSDHPRHDIFFVRGISGRPNSGVMILRGGKDSIAVQLLNACLSTRLETVPPDDFVTAEGENGHIIWQLQKTPFAQSAHELDRSWNCSIPEQAETAFVRHYTNRLRDHLNAKL